MALTIQSLPTEILNQIISLCPSSSVLALCESSRHLNEVVKDNSIWRGLCQREISYWSPGHNIDDLWHAAGIDWRWIFERRKRKDKEVLSILESILESQSGRIDKFQQIVDLGYDAKDCLLKQLQVPDDAEDCLSRRWYADAVLGCLHRSMAIEEWSKMYIGEGLSLERALGAFDMFVLHDRAGDFNETRRTLDCIANAIKARHPDFDSKTPRQKALRIAAYLTSRRLVGIRGPRGHSYHDLQNNFIGYALHDCHHASLPLQTAAIFCSVARRLGLDASPCALPFHVFVVVRAPTGINLDGVEVAANDKNQQDMFLDPFDTAEEIDTSVLSSRLYSVGTPAQLHSSYFGAAPISDLVLRTGRNILTSVQENHRLDTIFAQASMNPRNVVFTDVEGAFYGALWAALLFGRPPNGDGPVIATLNTRAYLPPFLEHFEAHFPNDTALIENHIIPMFRDSPESDQLRESVRVMRSVDVMPKQVKSRTKEISEKVQYRVGQVFQHKRYNYLAVITGWDIECGAGEQWMARMRIHELPGGSKQSFYHVLVEDKSVRYVAEENIEIVEPDEPGTLMALAGKHFKRWDYEERRFVSNIKDEYPDD